MRARLVFVLVGIAALVAFCAVVKRERERNGRLQLEAARLERLHANRLSLQEEHERLRQVLSSTGDLAELQKRRQAIEHNRSILNTLDLQVRSLKRTLGQPADPVWPDGATVVPSSQWKFAGQGSPADTLESVLWAAREGDVDRLAGLIELDPGTKAQADAFLARMPENSRTQFGSSEKIVATLIAAQMPTDYAAMGTYREAEPDPGSSLLGVRILDGTGNQRDFTFKFQLAQDSWRLDVPASVVSNLARQLNSAPVPK